MQWLETMVLDNRTPAGRAFDVFVQVLVVASLAAFSVETLPDLSDATRQWLNAFEVCTVAFFSLEYLVRLWAAENKRGFALSFFGIVDLLSILPFYLGSVVDLRCIRILRMLRLVRAFKLLRYTKALQRFRRALLIAREELVLYFIAALVVLYLSSVGIYYFEHDAQPDKFASIFDSLWWSVATLTTVGYGDIYPVTIGGRLFTFAILMVGLGFISVPTGLIAAAVSKARDMDQE